MHPHTKRLTSLVTLLAFLVTHSPAFSAPVHLGVSQTSPETNLDAGQIVIPSELGRIEEISKGTNNKTIILIQDAHAILDAQCNIEKLIQHFQKNYGLNSVMVEGAASELDPQIFRSFPDKKILQSVFNEYRENGELTGSAAAAIFNEIEGHYDGVEDWALYEEGLYFYLLAMQSKNELSQKLLAYEMNLQAKKQKTYSKKLSEIDGLLNFFYENQTSLVDVLKKLAAIREPEKGSELRALLDEVRLQGKDQSAIEIEVKEMAGKVAKLLNSSNGKNKSKPHKFNEKFQEFQASRISPQAFALFVKETILDNRLPLKISSRLLGLMDHQKKLRQIEGTKIFKDFEAYASDTKKLLFQNEEQQKLDRETIQLRLLKKLINLELSIEDWMMIEESSDQYDAILPQNLVSAHRSFYENAEKRDHAFTSNMARLLNQRKLTAAILVSGGFHTQGVSRELERDGYSVIKIFPRIDSMPQHSLYQDHMAGQVSWKDYLQVEDGKIDVFKAFVRATRDKLLKQEDQQQNLLLKLWRDQLIRDLSANGKIESASQYTQFLDEINESKKKLPASARLAKIDQFIEGLKLLQQKNDLTQQNVLQLLKTGTILDAFGIQIRHDPLSVGNDRLGYVKGRLVAVVQQIARSEMRSAVTDDEVRAAWLLELKTLAKEFETRRKTIPASPQKQAEDLKHFDNLRAEILDAISSAPAGKSGIVLGAGMLRDIPDDLFTSPKFNEIILIDLDKDVMFQALRQRGFEKQIWSETTPTGRIRLVEFDLSMLSVQMLRAIQDIVSSAKSFYEARVRLEQLYGQTSSQATTIQMPINIQPGQAGLVISSTLFPMVMITAQIVTERFVARSLNQPLPADVSDLKFASDVNYLTALFPILNQIGKTHRQLLSELASPGAIIQLTALPALVLPRKLNVSGVSLQDVESAFEALAQLYGGFTQGIGRRQYQLISGLQQIFVQSPMSAPVQNALPPSFLMNDPGNYWLGAEQLLKTKVWTWFDRPDIGSAHLVQSLTFLRSEMRESDLQKANRRLIPDNEPNRADDSRIARLRQNGGFLTEVPYAERANYYSLMQAKAVAIVGDVVISTDLDAARAQEVFSRLQSTEVLPDGNGVGSGDVNVSQYMMYVPVLVTETRRQILQTLNDFGPMTLQELQALLKVPHYFVQLVALHLSKQGIITSEIPGYLKGMLKMTDSGGAELSRLGVTILVRAKDTKGTPESMAKEMQETLILPRQIAEAIKELALEDFVKASAVVRSLDLEGLSMEAQNLIRNYLLSMIDQNTEQMIELKEQGLKGRIGKKYSKSEWHWISGIMGFHELDTALARFSPFEDAEEGLALIRYLAVRNIYSPEEIEKERQKVLEHFRRLYKFAVLIGQPLRASSYEQLLTDASVFQQREMYEMQDQDIEEARQRKHLQLTSFQRQLDDLIQSHDVRPEERRKKIEKNDYAAIARLLENEATQQEGITFLLTIVYRGVDGFGFDMYGLFPKELAELSRYARDSVVRNILAFDPDLMLSRSVVHAAADIPAAARLLLLSPNPAKLITWLDGSFPGAILNHLVLSDFDTAKSILLALPVKNQASLIKAIPLRAASKLYDEMGEHLPVIEPAIGERVSFLLNLRGQKFVGFLNPFLEAARQDADLSSVLTGYVQALEGSHPRLIAEAERALLDYYGRLHGSLTEEDQDALKWAIFRPEQTSDRLKPEMIKAKGIRYLIQNSILPISEYAMAWFEILHHPLLDPLLRQGLIRLTDLAYARGGNSIDEQKNLIAQRLNDLQREAISQAETDRKPILTYTLGEFFDVSQPLAQLRSSQFNRGFYEADFTSRDQRALLGRQSLALPLGNAVGTSNNRSELQQLTRRTVLEDRESDLVAIQLGLILVSDMPLPESLAGKLADLLEHKQIEIAQLERTAVLISAGIDNPDQLRPFMAPFVEQTKAELKDFIVEKIKEIKSTGLTVGLDVSNLGRGNVNEDAVVRTVRNFLELFSEAGFDISNPSNTFVISGKQVGKDVTEPLKTAGLNFTSTKRSDLKKPQGQLYLPLMQLNGKPAEQSEFVRNIILMLEGEFGPEAEELGMLLQAAEAISTATAQNEEQIQTSFEKLVDAVSLFRQYHEVIFGGIIQSPGRISIVNVSSIHNLLVALATDAKARSEIRKSA